jgi:signal transduction histidine kinase
VQQAFLSLVLNAVEAMPDGGQLRVRTAATRDLMGVLLTISDTRPGGVSGGQLSISEVLRKGELSGLDLGLQISKNIVEEHGGRLEVERRAGEGATFAVWLPARSTRTMMEGGQ